MINISINEIYLEEIKSYQKWYGGNNIYYNKKIGLVNGIISYISLFRRSSNLLGDGKRAFKVFSSVIVLKQTIEKTTIKKKINFSNNKTTKNDFKNIILNDNKESIVNYSLEHKVAAWTKKHPPFVEIVIDDNADCSLIVGNLTTSSNNSTYLAPKGMLHTKEVYVYNQISEEKLDEQKVNDLEELIKNNENVNYTTIIQSSEKYSNNINNLIENKTNKKIFLKNEQTTMDEKIKRIKSYHDDIERMNSRED